MWCRGSPEASPEATGYLQTPDPQVKVHERFFGAAFDRYPDEAGCVFISQDRVGTCFFAGT